MNDSLSNVVIRPETPADYGRIGAIHESAFGQPHEARLVEAIRAAPDFQPQRSIVAERDGELVGHVLLSPIVIRNGQQAFAALALAPVAVVPGWQGRGIGSMLVRAAIEQARAAGDAHIIVLGEPGFYRRFGFEPASRWHVRAPFDVPDEAFMVLSLTEAGMDGVAGTVEYPPCFLDVSQS